MPRFLVNIWNNFKEYIVLVVLLLTSLFTLSLNNNSSVKKVRAVAFGSFAAVTSVISDVINTGKCKNRKRKVKT